jgi:uncharacterized protein
MPHYIYRITPPRERFVETITPREEEIIGRHWEHLQAQFAAGKLNVVGRCESGAYGLVVFPCASEEEARRFMQTDPAISAGLMKAELEEFRLLLVRAPEKPL